MKTQFLFLSKCPTGPRNLPNLGIYAMNNTHPEKPQRRSIRLKEYDYSRPGAYFVTICTHNREPILGNIVNGKMELNLYGKIVSTRWRSLRRRHKYMDLDAFVVMPNHFHGIIVIRSGTKRDAVPDIVRGFKTFSARRINQERGTPGNPVWQRNYWEHVIRDQDSFRRIHDYISTNPLRWHLDRENPQREGEDRFDRWLDSL
jgi:putative transposase